MTRAELNAEMEKHGIPARFIAMAPRLDLDGDDDSASLVLVVESFALDGEGVPYMDHETWDLATEVRRIPVASLSLDLPASVQAGRRAWGTQSK